MIKPSIILLMAYPFYFSFPLVAAEENLTVHGIPLKTIHDSVEDIVSSSKGTQVSRWNDFICLGVYGLKNKYQKIISNYIIGNSSYSGINVSSSCEDKNVMILFTNNYEILLNSLLKMSPDLWQYYRQNADLYQKHIDVPKELLPYLKNSLPVHWIESRGRELASGYYSNDISPLGVNQPVIYGEETSLLSTSTVYEKHFMIVIVNMNSASGVTFRQLGDYISMVIFADPVMKDNYAQFTILSLFSKNRSHPSSLTDFDKNLLKTLYAINPNQERSDFYWDLSEKIFSLSNASQ